MFHALKTLARARMLSQAIPAIDASPPIGSALKSIDKAAFYKAIPVLAVRVNPTKAGLFLKSNAMRGYAFLSCFLLTPR